MSIHDTNFPTTSRHRQATSGWLVSYAVCRNTRDTQAGYTLHTSVPRVLIRFCTDSNQAYLSGSVLTATKCIHTRQALYWQQPSVLIRLCTDSNQVYSPGSVLTAIEFSVLTNIIVIKCIQQHLYWYWCHSKQVYSQYLFYITLHICTNADVMAIKHTHQYLQPGVSQLSHTAFSHAVLNGRVPHRLLKTALDTRTCFKDGFYYIWGRVIYCSCCLDIFQSPMTGNLVHSLLAVIWSYTFVRADIAGLWKGRSLKLLTHSWTLSYLGFFSIPCIPYSHIKRPHP